MDTQVVANAVQGSFADSLQYFPILLLVVIGTIMGFGMVKVTEILGPRVFHPRKNEPFECGVPIHEDTSRRFSVRFYLVAILFLLFDVEVIFFYPYAIVFREFLKVNSFIVWEMLFFVLTLLVGYFYIRRRGALEWD
jgi:NADH-quinone oxidoreductase subunit A